MIKFHLTVVFILIRILNPVSMIDASLRHAQSAQAPVFRVKVPGKKTRGIPTAVLSTQVGIIVYSYTPTLEIVYTYYI